MTISAGRTLIVWAADRFASARVLSEPPANLQEELPVIVIKPYGGSDPQLTISRPLVDFDVYAATWADAETLSLELHDALRIELPGTLVELPAGSVAPAGRVSVSKVSTSSLPSQRPTSDPKIRRCGASYEIRMQAR